MRRLARSVFHVSLAAILLLATVYASNAAPPNDPLYAWLGSRESLRSAARLIAKLRLQEADAELSRLARDLPMPYRKQASEAIEKLRPAMKTDRTLDAYHRYANLGDVCRDLDAPRGAADLYWRAVRGHPQDHNDVSSRLAQMLIAVKADEKEFHELENIVANDIYKRDLREALKARKEQFARSDDDILKAFEQPGMAGFVCGVSLEDLNRLLPKAKNNAQRLAVYWRTSGELESLGDFQGRDAWEEKILREFKHDPNACAAVYYDRGERAYRAKDRAKALEMFRKVCADYRRSDACGEAWRQIGMILRRQGKYDEAIAAYRQLMPDKSKKVDVDCLEAGPIACCYEAKGDFTSALEWVEAIETAHGNHGIGCLNCYYAESARLTLWKAALFDKLGRSDDALKLIEPQVFKNECDDAAFLLVDIYHRRGQLEKLDEKIAEAKKRNVASNKLEYAKHPDRVDPSYDGVTDSMKVANAYLALRRMIDKGDVDGLFTIIEGSEDNAFGTFVRFPSEPAPSWQVTKTLAALDNLGERAVPFLRKQLDGSPRSQGWAFVLLRARRGRICCPSSNMPVR